MVAPLGAARRGTPLPGIPFSREAVANAFVMLGLVPERRAEEILAEHRHRLKAEGFRIGVLTGELSVRPGAHGFQDALEAVPPACGSGPAPAGVTTGTADPPWPTPAECYLAVLASSTSVSIGTADGTVELDTARITATVADALLRVGALPPDSVLLSGGSIADAGHPPDLESLVHPRDRHARQRADSGGAGRAALAVRLPLRQATAVIESISAHEDLVSVCLYGYPWVTGEYWPMIAPCFQVRAVDDAGGEHESVLGGGGGSPEGSHEFMFWPVPSGARRLRVIVSTLWEAAWAEMDIPGRLA